MVLTVRLQEQRLLLQLMAVVDRKLVVDPSEQDDALSDEVVDHFHFYLIRWSERDLA